MLSVILTLALPYPYIWLVYATLRVYDNVLDDNARLWDSLPISCERYAGIWAPQLDEQPSAPQADDAVSGPPERCRNPVSDFFSPQGAQSVVRFPTARRHHDFGLPVSSAQPEFDRFSEPAVHT